ncbi:MAG TPA: hypothetical protein VET23_14030 [Chitinophagaceae bacterium]|nr:hypothetical protein [Chitinophagaceae bacterium]
MQLQRSHKTWQGKGNSNSGPPQTTTTIHLPEATQFKLLDLEFALPVNYTANKFKFSFTPTYIVPESPATLMAGTNLVNEKISSSLIVEAEIDYRF